MAGSDRGKAARVRELCQKLKPIIGDQAERCWMAYIAENETGKAQIENYLELIGAEYLRSSLSTDEPTLLPPEARAAAGPYVLGTVRYNGADLHPFGLREDEWTQHVGIFGRSGAGKTNLGFLVVQELLAHDKPLLIFDWKRNYRDLVTLPGFENVAVFTIGRAIAPLSFNPLIPPRGTPPQTWLKKLIGVLAHAYLLGDGVMFLLQEAIDDVYRRSGVYENRVQRWPTMRDVQVALRSRQSVGREAGWMSSALRALSSLCFGEMDVLINQGHDDLDALLTRPVILELDALTQSDKVFFAQAVLLWIHHRRMVEPIRETFKHAIILEEAHHVLSDVRQSMSLKHAGNRHLATATIVRFESRDEIWRGIRHPIRSRQDLIYLAKGEPFLLSVAITETPPRDRESALEPCTLERNSLSSGRLVRAPSCPCRAPPRTRKSVFPRTGNSGPRQRKTNAQHRYWLLAIVVGTASLANGQDLPGFDFTKGDGAQGWEPAHDVVRLDATCAGLEIETSGSDPYLHGPPRDFPAGQPLWLHIRLKSDQAGMGQVFYFNSKKAANEADSARFAVPGGQWEDISVPLPPLGGACRLRLDPPGGAGNRVIVASLRVETRILLKAPDWPVPTPPTLDEKALSLQSGDLELVHARDQIGAFALRVAGQSMAAGHNRPLIGYLHAGELRWLELGKSASVQADRDRGALVVQATVHDEDGAAWTIREHFAPGAKPRAIDVTVTVSASRSREVVYLPMLMILPGLGCFGETKNQAVFPGLEYLDRNEPSSSEADIIGPGARRQVPDTLKITLPLIAVQADGRYVGLLWEQRPEFAAVFDSPDRLFKSGAHVIGILFPGANGTNRADSSLLPYGGETLQAGQTVALRATIVGGRGESIIPAVQQYVALRGLPPMPTEGVDWNSYFATAAAGWLGSGIRAGSRYRHALPGNFDPQPAADAAVMMDWLALQTREGSLKQRLAEAAKTALAEVKPGDLNHAGVSHVRYPVPALVYGHAAESADRARQVGRELLQRFEPDGSVCYRKPPSGPDYGRTHFAPDANGLTAQAVASLLELASVSGDSELLSEGLRCLRAIDKFANTVPRGAQTWEVPLHTPDILAAANLVRAYTLGYELTNERHFLEHARYWAWSGVPFTYLVAPANEPVGAYATIPVFGATQWVAPDWMGLPVQWCGLVYADAVYRLARYDPTGPWKQLADGITAAGIQQTWPRSGDAERQGLLPDSFTLRAQLRNDPAINPGTVQANAIRFFDRPALYDFHAFGSGVLVHAPGAIRDAVDEAARTRFTVNGWPDHPYQILIVGLKSTPRVRINDHDIPLDSSHAFDARNGRLILGVEGKPVIEIGR
ncbi:MAG: DUF87 domain-containing protein [Phycisphaerales bacterium]|nr:DUF87 domain-containing protein [Phycisphaerales bacterium]